MKPRKPIQFDLFEKIDLRPKADVLIIPPHRRRALVESTAMQLLGRTNRKKADAFWTATINDLRKELRRFGVDEAEAAGRLIQFQMAVQETINAVMAPTTTNKDSA